MLKNHLPRLGDAGRGGRGAAHLGQGLEEQRLGGVEPIGGRSTLIARRGEILGKHGDGGGPRATFGKAEAAKAPLGDKGSFRDGGKAGKGAKIGTAAGGLLGGMNAAGQNAQASQARRDWERQEANRYASARAQYNRAFATCMEGRGYAVK